MRFLARLEIVSFDPERGQFAASLLHEDERNRDVKRVLLDVLR
jgi:hypothetical protein